MRPRARRSFATAVITAALAAATVAAAPSGGAPATTLLTDALAEAEAAEARPIGPPPAGRARPAHARDRYDMAGGCYAVRSRATGDYVARTDGGFAASAGKRKAAEPFHFQAFDLGKYLLYGRQADFLASEGDPTNGGAEPALDTAEGYVNGTGDENLEPARVPARAAIDGARAGNDAVQHAADGTAIVAAGAPSWYSEWVVQQVGKGTFTIHRAVDDNEPENPGPLDPELVATLVAQPDGTLTLADGYLTGKEARFAFERTRGCASWPEVDINVRGDHPTGDSPIEQTRGYMDAHLHMMAFEFLGGRVRCGRPWHPYGVTHALVDCPDHEPGGRGAVLEQILSGQNPGEGHDTTGWPTFGYWPHHGSYTHEQIYYKWLERSWRGGLRMFTNLLVDNGVLCEVYPYKENSCNEMDGVRLQAQRLRELERYIDAQWGGPGEGWFRIVDDPFEARRIINAGKLAVVMGIEVSVLFDCGETLGVPRCDEAQIDRQLEQVYDLGVRQLELVNKFDNALSGVAGDSGSTGVIVNQGNRYETGHYWRMDTCQETHDHGLHAHDETQSNLHDDAGTPAEFTGRDALAGAVLAAVGTSGAAPVYPQGPHCNQMGLSDLGTYLLDRMMEKGIIFDPDHMSAKARDEALEHVAEAGYSGVVSSHSWADDLSYFRIWQMGGVVAPMTKSSDGFVEKWRKQRSWRDDRFLFGLGYGADTNGFASQGAPRGKDVPNPVRYPFRGMGGVVIDQQRSGERVYDINVDGVAHYGLYPDWIEDVRILAGEDGDQFIADMERGAEAYLQMWERGIGIPGNACRADVADLTAEQLGRVERGMTAAEVLATLGQPQVRDDRTFEFCAAGGTAVVTFDGEERVSGTATRADALVDQQPGGREAVAADSAATGGRDAAAGARGAASAAAGTAHDHASHDHGLLAAVTGDGSRAMWIATIASALVLGSALRRVLRRSGSQQR